MFTDTILYATNLKYDTRAGVTLAEANVNLNFKLKITIAVIGSGSVRQRLCIRITTYLVLALRTAGGASESNHTGCLLLPS
jgi:hypothetical protein